MRRFENAAPGAAAPATSGGRAAVALAAKIPAALALVAQQRHSGAVCATAASSESAAAAAAVFMMDGSGGSPRARRRGSAGGNPGREQWEPAGGRGRAVTDGSQCTQRCLGGRSTPEKEHLARPAGGPGRQEGGCRTFGSTFPLHRVSVLSGQSSRNVYASRLSQLGSSVKDESVSAGPGGPVIRGATPTGEIPLTPTGEIPFTPKGKKALTPKELRQALEKMCTPPTALCKLVGEFSAQNVSNWADALAEVLRPGQAKPRSSSLGGSWEVVGELPFQQSSCAHTAEAPSSGGVSGGPGPEEKRNSTGSSADASNSANVPSTCDTSASPTDQLAGPSKQLDDSALAGLLAKFEAFLKTEPPQRLSAAEGVLRELSSFIKQCESETGENRGQVEGKLVCTSVATYFALFLLREGVIGAELTGIKVDPCAGSTVLPPCLDHLRSAASHCKPPTHIAAFCKYVGNDASACKPPSDFAAKLAVVNFHLYSLECKEDWQGSILTLLQPVVQTAAECAGNIDSDQLSLLMTVLRQAFRKMVAEVVEPLEFNQEFSKIESLVTYADDLRSRSLDASTNLDAILLVQTVSSLVFTALRQQQMLKSPTACTALEAALRGAQRHAEWLIGGRDLLHNLEASAKGFSPEAHLMADAVTRKCINTYCEAALKCINTYCEAALKLCFEDFARLFGRAAAVKGRSSGGGSNNSGGQVQ